MKEIKLSDEWQTPQWLFDELNKEFNFDIDLCANENNAKCDIFYRDYLNNRVTVKNYCADIKESRVKSLIQGKCCFMNPPYSNPKPFIQKAWEDSRYCRIVALVKCDPSTRWWATFWDYESTRWVDEHVFDLHGVPCMRGKEIKYNGPKPGCEVRFFPKRIKFDPPKQLVSRCSDCLDYGYLNPLTKLAYELPELCEHKNKIKNSGPTFPSVLVIMDRRNLCQ